jgi:hypothetical protein
MVAETGLWRDLRKSHIPGDPHIGTIQVVAMKANERRTTNEGACFPIEAWTVVQATGVSRVPERVRVNSGHGVLLIIPLGCDGCRLVEPGTGHRQLVAKVYESAYIDRTEILSRRGNTLNDHHRAR